ncbi:hypothetical protein PV08_10474 [Exophiala spinifera]|uniref:SP-RING-type domain-containing protein n=1 Tax=Exophiala spinifera TaxID=91928 RepID=A0A0D2BII2_9EURO|nr:uncharacterized protein PV08_10474 [Exophiala spinifera]KIW11174.1 hypothetical protein PV08_10474 [Exophiala spinifera]
MPTDNPTSSSPAGRSDPSPLPPSTTSGEHANGAPSHSSVHRLGKRRRKASEITNRRDSRTMISSDKSAASSQLPTPLNSPITPGTNILTMQFESALARIGTVNAVDRQRISMLGEACRVNDVFFIVMHLFFCSWSSGQPQVVSQLGLDQSHVSGLMNLQQHLLFGNRYLSPAVAELFSRFPVPANHCLTPTPTPQALVLASQVSPVKRFLSTLVQDWTTTWNVFSRAEGPPCPIQLKYFLKLPSVVLQATIYKMFVRLRTADARWSTIASELFEQALKDPAQTTLSVEELVAANGSQVTKPAADFLRQYMSTMARYFAGQPGLQGQSLPRQGESNQVSALASRTVQLSPVPVPEPAAPLFYQQASIGSLQPGLLSDVAGPIRASHTEQLPFTVPQGQAPTMGAVMTPAQAMLNSCILPTQTFTIHQNTGHQPRNRTSIVPQGGGDGHVQAQRGAHVPQMIPVTAVRQARPRDAFMGRDGNVTLPILATPEPDRYALHQADLHTPPMDKVNSLDGVPQSKWYQYVETIITRSKLLNVDSPMAEWTFEVPEQYWARKAQSEEVVGDSFTAHRKIVNGSTQFRLKCIGSDNNQDLQNIAESEYITLPTQWPRHLSASVNDNMGIDFRRRAHHGADIPADVTDYFQEGVNEVVICINFDPRERSMSYLMAIEVITVADREVVRSMVGQADAADVMASIVATLQSHPDGTDDADLVVAQSYISIDLVDPFMSCIWSTPTRSRACRHRECFDLDAYLDSRTNHGGVTKPDQWKCPICKKDARPQMLVIDGFLTNVRKALDATDSLDVKAIVVSRDGSWETKVDPSVQAKVKPRNDMQAPNSHAHAAGASDLLSNVSGEADPTSTPQTEVFIILDDDDDDDHDD